MSYAGHVIDMINRMKQNREQIKSRREKIARLYDKMSTNSHRGAYQLKKKYSEVELERIKAKIKNEINQERRHSFILAITLTVFICLLLIFLYLKYLSSGNALLIN